MFSEEGHGLNHQGEVLDLLLERREARSQCQSQLKIQTHSAFRSCVKGGQSGPGKEELGSPKWELLGCHKGWQKAETNSLDSFFSWGRLPSVEKPVAAQPLSLMPGDREERPVVDQVVRGGSERSQVAWNFPELSCQLEA